MKKAWQIWIIWKGEKQPVKLGDPLTENDGLRSLERLMKSPRVKDAWIHDGKKEMRPVKGDD